MAYHRIDGKRVAILATDGFEQEELTSPVKAISDAGGMAVIIAPDARSIRGWKHDDWGDSVDVHRPLEEAKADDFDALVLPGGVMSPDKLRINEKATKFVRDFFEQGKPVAAICHGPWMLINAGVVAGRRLTSYHSIRIDLENAGAEWVDEEVVVDEGLVTSRKPDDLEAFNAKMVEEIAEGIHAGQRA